MLGVTGQRNKNVATKVVADLATAATMEELRNPDSPINRTDLSGKHEGSAVIVKKEDGNYSIFVATGSKPTDVWKELLPTVPEQDFPIEYIDMIDILVHPDSASKVKVIPGTKTVLIQTPMFDVEGEMLYRNNLSAKVGLNWSTGSAAADTIKFKVNGILDSEEEYYSLDTVQAFIYTNGNGAGFPEVMVAPKDARTNEFGIRVNTMPPDASQFGLNITLEWTSPTRIMYAK